MTRTRCSILLALMLVAVFSSLAGFAHAAQRVFPTPQAAAQALYEAARAGDRTAIAAVLGPGSADVIESGDPAEDMVGRARFVGAYEELARIEAQGAARAELVIGAEAWRVPFPLVREARGWRFDARAGRDEVVRRRVGRNELVAMQSALAYVDAQREYALEPHDGAGPGLYAQRIASTPERHDGLYWTPTRDGPLSPLGLMFMLAAADESAAAARPYHGYLFRVLLAQGAHAPGGAADFVVGGRMIGGFALVAYPARYRVTGVRTFIVSHDGAVFSRDLGAATAKAARAMARFDPDGGWRLEAAAVARAEPDERMRHLAGERGCTLCHAAAPVPREADAAMALAPSWREIAARYRGRDDAEELLTRAIIEGADPAERHWKQRLEFNAMQGNPRIGPDEARALVRWILTMP